MVGVWEESFGEMMVVGWNKDLRCGRKHQRREHHHDDPACRLEGSEQGRIVNKARAPASEDIFARPPVSVHGYPQAVNAPGGVPSSSAAEAVKSCAILAEVAPRTAGKACWLSFAEGAGRVWKCWKC